MDNYLLTGGDLCQLFEQKRLLLNHNFHVTSVDVYPCLKTKEEFVEALTLIWVMKCSGWWNYETQFFENNICTPEQFKERFK